MSKEPDLVNAQRARGRLGARGAVTIGRRRAVVALLLATLLGAWLPPSPDPWEVRSISPSDLVALSDYIVVAAVTKVESAGEDLRVATATVVDRWKGDPGPAIRFRASGTWTCDISSAKAGESSILFLTRTAGQEALSIAHSGRGRLPIKEIDGTLWARPRGDVQWPKELLQESPLNTGEFATRLIRVADVLAIVQSVAPTAP